MVLDIEGYENIVLTNMIKTNYCLPKIIVCEFDWSDKQNLINIIKIKYTLIKEFKHDFIFQRIE